MDNGILIIGAGGHAKVVADILLNQGTPVIGFLDDDAALWGQQRLGLPILGSIDSFAEYRPDGLILGIGGNGIRQLVRQRLGKAAKALWHTAIHPRAIVAESVKVGAGTVICGGVVVNPDTIIGKHAIINTGATVDHDCRLGDFVHVAPGAHLTGTIRVGTGAFIGAGAVCIPGKTVGEWATVGAGAVITQDIPAQVTAVGIPARW
jgi:sugar O-acyltransferase (sialic acid O-acetyltransferase NeuD family)